MMNPGAHERAIENLNRLVRDEINKLSGLETLHRHNARQIPIHLIREEEAGSIESENDLGSKLNLMSGHGGGATSPHELHSNIGSSYAELHEVLIRSKQDSSLK